MSAGEFERLEASWEMWNLELGVNMGEGSPYVEFETGGVGEIDKRVNNTVSE